jgi:hypothetical protein
MKSKILKFICFFAIVANMICVIFGMVYFLIEPQSDFKNSVVRLIISISALLLSISALAFTLYRLSD